MSVHSTFILSPIEQILNDVGSITSGIEDGISTYPLWEYILQSVFLKMTGAQEQKFKCVCWEISSVDFDIRRNIYVKWDLGECSTLKHKKAIIKYLVDAIKKLKRDFKPETGLNLTQIFQETKGLIDQFYETSGIRGVISRGYEEYNEVFSSIGSYCLSYDTIFKNCDNCSHNKDKNKPWTCSVKKGLSYMYNALYDHRNRCAHNILSYQHNRPSLETLLDSDSIYENYLIRFSLLILIDKVLIDLFKIFKEEVDSIELF